MPPINNRNKDHQEIKGTTHAFYGLMQLGDAEQVYAMLSPNLRQLTLEEQHAEKYQSCFKFGRIICGHSIYDLIEIKEGFFDSTVLVCVMDEKAKPVSKTGKYSEEDQRYCAFKIQFIKLNGCWFIDDITLYNEFWSNEFKELLKEHAGQE
ncbi:hypothetical protein A4D02_30820 [Niastella koreensis]|uniref:NTF2 fold immunity protein domain-containing protein n=2 Tax=Niastella koreensis TaxID=354356 RepID=G8T8Y7_NIAKG|nr:hypothetical protein [Niastella koreensis]AEW02344.1 hypothetical protein Niako_6119 [Niastella koreensis GR20-10]OQP46436.1 hypothetical protein A4D02_30820 [Niastella koreensis]